MASPAVTALARTVHSARTTVNVTCYDDGTLQVFLFFYAQYVSTCAHSSMILHSSQPVHLTSVYLFAKRIGAQCQLILLTSYHHSLTGKRCFCDKNNRKFCAFHTDISLFYTVVLK